MKIEQFFLKAEKLLLEGKASEAVSLLKPFASGNSGDFQSFRLYGIGQLMSFDNLGAFETFRKALVLKPEDYQINRLCSRALELAGKHQEAAKYLRKTIELAPLDIESWASLGINLAYSGNPDEAILIYEKLLAENQEALALGVGAVAFQYVDRKKHLEVSRLAAAKFPQDSQFQAMYAMTLCYTEETDKTKLREAHLNYVKTIVPPAKIYYDREDNDLAKKQVNTELRRLGVLTSDFRDCAVRNFLLPFVKALSITGFEVVFYATQKMKQEDLKKFSSFGKWAYESVPSHEKIAEKIFADKIQLLIEVNGLTELSVPHISMARPAPLQIHAIGYPSQTYWPWIDAKLTDAETEINPGDSNQGEELVVLQRCFVCYDIEQNRPEISTRAFDKNRVVFGCFNNPFKISEDCLESFKAVLLANPGSTLSFKHLNLSSDSQRREIKRYFEKVDLLARINFFETGLFEEKVEHLLFFNEIDILLDTFPYNGTTTTCDALFMGVPVITLVGNTHISRVSYSILKSVGYETWCASSLGEIASVTKDCIQNFPRKSEVQLRFIESEMNNIENYGRHLSEELHKTWGQKFNQD